MDLIEIAILLIAGVAAGFINVNAGGGSFLTLPVLILTGLSPVVANGTNRIALAAANITAIMNFKKNGFFEWKKSLLLGIPAAAGAVAGAIVSIRIPEGLYNTMLGIAIIVVVAVIFINPEKIKKHPFFTTSTAGKAVSSFCFFLLGVYGGVIQAGVGFFIIASLVFITGYSLVKINSMKVIIAFIYTVCTIAVFAFTGNIDWMYALVLSIGNGVGALLGSRFAVKKGDRWIRYVLALSAVIMALRILGVF